MQVIKYSINTMATLFSYDTIRQVMLLFITLLFILSFGLYAMYAVVDVWEPAQSVAEYNADRLADMQELSMGGY